jgi:hypothetical protein
MKLAIAEYLRSLKERDQLDRLLPDLLVEMGYTPTGRPQTGNRQYGVDIAARGLNPDTEEEELLLLVVKQGDIGRTEWDSGNQSVRQSINEIFDVYLKLYLEPKDKNKPIRIILATNGELKQTVQSNWSGYVNDNKDKAKIEFWGIDDMSVLIEKHLLNEHIFQDEDKQNLRRALALSGDSEYDARDLYKIFLRALNLDDDGNLKDESINNKTFLKKLNIVNLSVKIFCHWTFNPNNDSKQGLFAMERALLWTWHRIQLSDDDTKEKAIKGVFASLWGEYIRISSEYFSRIQPTFFVENSLIKYSSNGMESSLIAFEQMGILSSLILFEMTHPVFNEEEMETHFEGANIIADGLSEWINNNGATCSPCLDSHSQDITLALYALSLLGRIEFVKEWLKIIFRNVDYAYKTKKYVPIATDSYEDLVEEGGWLEGKASERMMEMSWTLATIAGWAALLGMDELYSVAAKNANEEYPNVCIQLWHPENDLFKYLYFQTAHFESGVTEAPIKLPSTAAEYRGHMLKICQSEFGKALADSPAFKAKLTGLDIIAYRHFQTPIPPAFWYGFMASGLVNYD